MGLPLAGCVLIECHGASQNSWFYRNHSPGLPKPFHPVVHLNLEVMKSLVLPGWVPLLSLVVPPHFAYNFVIVLLSINSSWIILVCVCSVSIGILIETKTEASKTAKKTVIARTGSQNLVSRSLGNSELHHLHFCSLVRTSTCSGSERNIGCWFRAYTTSCKMALIPTGCCFHVDSKALWRL